MTTSYSSRGELLSATLPNGTVITYDHDPMGRRIAKRVNGNITERYLWANATTLLAVYDASDNLIMRFTYADSRTPFSMTYNGHTYYLVYDQIGSLKAVSDSTGNIIKQIDYDSFGSIINDTNPSLRIPFGFAGGLYDGDTNLVRFGARDYDPTIGRWTAKDPIDFAGRDTNLYGYVEGNPVNRRDPRGLFGPGGPGSSYLGHADFPGGDYFDFNLEDNDPITSPFADPGRHFRDLPQSQSDVNAAINSCDKEAFERASHRGQDFFSHYENGYRWKPFQWWKNLGLGHVFDGTEPDKDTNAWQKAADWTNYWLLRWKEKCKCN